MTPDEAIGISANATTIPREAILWARAHWAEMAPHLHQMLPAFTREPDRKPAIEAALFFLIHIAAEQSDTSIHAALCRLLLEEEAAELALGDATTDTLPGLLVSTYGGDPTSIQAVLEADSTDPYVRGGALIALARLTHDGRLTETWMRGYLHRLFDAVLPREPDPVWTDWVGAVSGLGYQEFVPEVEEAFRHGWVEPMVMELRHFREDLELALREPGAGFGGRPVEPFTDLIGLLERWGFDKPVTARDAIPSDPLATPLPATPYVNPMRHIGRNDPCPCGSGRKYKKCCLAVQHAVA